MDYTIETLDKRPNYYRKKIIKNVSNLDVINRRYIFTTKKGKKIKRRMDTWKVVSNKMDNLHCETCNESGDIFKHPCSKCTIQYLKEEVYKLQNPEAEQIKNEQRELKLYVWEEFCPDYSDGLAFAIAESLEEAKEMLKENFGLESSYGPVTEHEIKKTAYGVYGGA